MSEKPIYNQDIKKIELTFEGHCCIDLEEVFEGRTNPFTEGKVKQWWVKHGTLYVELDDDTTPIGVQFMIEEDVTDFVAEAYDNLDTKWPTHIMVEDNEGNWHRRDLP